MALQNDNLDQISSLEKHFVCHHCNLIVKNKKVFITHIKRCSQKIKINKCKHCPIKFSNNGLYVKHLILKHKDFSESAETFCNVCKKFFPRNLNLVYHIRQEHFNLKSKVPYATKKKVNQVWFENVINSNNILEIKKTGQNCLVMRKLNENTAIKVPELKTEDIDLTTVYPVPRKKTTKGSYK